MWAPIIYFWDVCQHFVWLFVRAIVSIFVFRPRRSVRVILQLQHREHNLCTVKVC